MLLPIFLAATFSYHVERDPFTDEPTYIAFVGSERGPSIVVQCDKSLGLVVGIKPGRSLYSGRFEGVALYDDRFRFDERPPITFKVSYRNDTSVMRDAIADKFLTELVTSSRMVVEMTDYQARSFILEFSTVGAADSVARVKASCFTPKDK